MKEEKKIDIIFVLFFITLVIMFALSIFLIVNGNSDNPREEAFMTCKIGCLTGLAYLGLELQKTGIDNQTQMSNSLNYCSSECERLFK